MRALADGRVRWGFWAPGADVSGREGKGIWLDTIPGAQEGDDSGAEIDDVRNELLSELEEDEDEASESEEESVGQDLEEEASPSEDDESEGSSERHSIEKAPERGGGFFAALDEGSDEQTDEEEDDEVEDEGEDKGEQEELDGETNEQVDLH
jgi:hypothetical protein